jgi:hypothetical protein
MYLTEKGFVAAKGAESAAPAQPEAANGQAANGQAQQQAPNGAKVEEEIKILEKIAKSRKQRSRIMILGIVVVIAAAVAFLVLDKIIVL